MRKILIPSITLLALAGIANAADQSTTAVVDRHLADQAISQTGGSNKPAAAAAAIDSPDSVVGGVLAMAHRVENEFDLVEATEKLRFIAEKPQDWGSVAAGMQAAMMQDSAAREYIKPLLIVTAGAVVSADWQGSYGLCAVDLPHNYPGNLLSFGLGVERLDVEGGDGVTCAIETIGRLAPQWRLGDSRWTAGPALTARVGGSSHGLVIGWDALAHAEYALAPGLAAVFDVGAGQRFDDFEVSDVLPQIGGGLSFLF